MAEQLRRNYIVTAMVCVSVLLIGMAAFINILNYTSLNTQSDKLLEELVETFHLNPVESIVFEDVSESEETEEFSADSSGDAGKSDMEENADSSRDSGRGIQDFGSDVFDDYRGSGSYPWFLFNRVSDNDVRSAVYYTVAVNRKGEIIGTDVSHVAETQEEDAQDQALELFQKGRISGWSEHCKFIATEDYSGNYVYVFLYRGRDILNSFQILLVSLIAMILCFVIMLVVVSLLSHRIIKPIAVNIERQKSFVTDASHEIKTPLAIIQSNAEALELYNGQNKWTGNIKDQIQRLTGLLNHMLAMARAEEVAVGSDVRDIDLTLLLQEVLKMFQEPADQRGLSFQQDIAEGLKIRAGRIPLIQMISALLDNAVKYAKKDTAISFRAFSRERQITLETGNYCEVLPECEPDRLFDRFFRPDVTRYGSEPGNGVGLSAALAIAQSLGGNIRCRYEDGCRIFFTLTLKH